jgi:aspartate-semialdehyde dehydrogenase
MTSNNRVVGMSKKYNVAVVGATGLVGETMMSILEERNFPVGDIHLLASSRSAGETLKFGKRKVTVRDLSTFDFKGVDIGLFSAGGSVSAEYAPRAAEAGCVVIDNTSFFRQVEDIPLVVPEVNPEAIAAYTNHGIIANPNCSTIQMLVALKPLRDAFGIHRIIVSTYQAVSGAGRRHMEDLAKQTALLMNGRPTDSELYKRPLAFNVLPQIDVFEDNGYTREEMKMVRETRKIFADPDIRVTATAVRVPVFFGHSESIYIETRDPVTVAQARKLLKKAPGVVLMDDPAKQKYPTASTDAANKDAVFVGRVRQDLDNDCGLNLWVVADNVRKGAALNSVQIAELLVKDYL